MLRNYDQSELLELIEGQLEPSKAALLRAKLASDPDQSALAMVNRMSADRARLQSLPDPELPMDFMAESERLLARPMLMESAPPAAIARPGQYRRYQRRMRWRVRWPRLAAAAVVLLAAAAGVWWAATLATPPRSAGDLVAVDETRLEGPATDAHAAAALLDELHGIIHHAPPAPPSEAFLHGVHAGLGSNQADESSGRPRAHSEPVRMVDAGFALVISSADLAVTEHAIGSCLTDAADRSALVRNFSFEEARQLEREWRIAHGGSADPPAVTELHSSTQGGASRAMSELAEHVRQQLSNRRTVRRSVAEPNPESSSGTLAGAKELVPSLEQQLELSSRGATHTVVIPVASLSAMLEQIGTSTAHSTMLRTLPAASRDSDRLHSSTFAGPPPLLMWLTDGSQVRAAMQKILAEDHEALVRLPVMIQANR
jgi:hypothetical protein